MGDVGRRFGRPERTGWRGALVWQQQLQVPDLLYILQWDTKRGGWELPKGGPEPVDLSPLDTAIREVREETGADLTVPRPGFWVDSAGIRLDGMPRRSRSAYLVTPFNITNGDREVRGRAGVCWMTTTQFAEYTRSRTGRRRFDHLAAMQRVDLDFAGEAATPAGGGPTGGGGLGESFWEPEVLETGGTEGQVPSQGSAESQGSSTALDGCLSRRGSGGQQTGAGNPEVRSGTDSSRSAPPASSVDNVEFYPPTDTSAPPSPGLSDDSADWLPSRPLIGGVPSGALPPPTVAHGIRDEIPRESQCLVFSQTDKQWHRGTVYVRSRGRSHRWKAVFRDRWGAWKEKEDCSTHNGAPPGWLSFTDEEDLGVPVTPSSRFRGTSEIVGGNPVAGEQGDSSGGRGTDNTVGIIATETPAQAATDSMVLDRELLTASPWPPSAGAIASSTVNSLPLFGGGSRAGAQHSLGQNSGLG